MARIARSRRVLDLHRDVRLIGLQAPLDRDHLGANPITGSQAQVAGKERRVCHLQAYGWQFSLPFFAA